jgi:hypothetical protein
LKQYANPGNLLSYVFPYSFVSKYNYNKIDVYQDNKNGLFYVLHHGKKLYYSRQFKTQERVKQSYNAICLEQDESSPHRYTNSIFDVNENDVVVDIGAAEGNFSLEVVEKAKELYIFETDSNWIEALNETFKPWQGKVKVINKFVSHNNNQSTVSLDTFFLNKKIDFIKIDVEGEENAVLKGAKNILERNNSLKLAICTYHNQKDAKIIANELMKYRYQCSFSDGFMLFLYSKMVPPFFRRGLIRAIKS